MANPAAIAVTDASTDEESLVEAWHQYRARLIKRDGTRVLEHNTDINGAILILLERFLGEKPSDTIWDPPR